MSNNMNKYTPPPRYFSSLKGKLVKSPNVMEQIKNEKKERKNVNLQR